MEQLLSVIGIFTLILLTGIGLLAGWLAGKIAGNTPLYMAIGALAALATPFIVAALGLTALIASGIVAILLVAAVGTVLVLVLVRLISGRSKD